MLKNINKTILLLVIFCFNCGVIAQNILPTPPTPQATQFIRYGEIPVGHTTGVPQIEIPIYTINAGLIDIPISISYHASGFKVNDVASPVGLGWVVNANGWLISRIVQGIPDHYSRYKDYKLDSDNTIRTPEDLEKVKKGQKKIGNTDFSNKVNAEAWHTYFIRNGSLPMADVRSDRYFYSLPGHIGSALYSADNMSIGLQTVPYEPLVFNYNVNNETYTITDTKGIIYTFAQKEYNKDGKDSHISSWYLTQIQFPGLSDVVTFSYKEGVEFTTQNYVQTDTYYTLGQVVQRNDAVECVDPYNPIRSLQGTSYTTKPVLLTEIKWKNTAVRFTYATDRNDILRERLTQINVYSKSGNNESCIKQVKFNNNTYFGTEKKNYRLKLSGIEFTYSGEKYTFSYDESKNNNLPGYYWFTGNDIKCAEDYWGYWNGKSSVNVFPQAVADYFNKSYAQNKYIKGADKDPSLEHTRACMLTEIKYPTKGKTYFEYELNVGSFNSTQIKTKNGKLGGLRVLRITNYSDDNSIAGIKEYEYSGKSIYSQYTDFSFENLFVTNTKPFVDFYSLATPGTSISMAQLIKPTTYSSTPLQCFFDASRSPVFYNNVTEYNGTKNNNNGWSVFCYTKANERVSTAQHNYTGPHELHAFVKSVDCDFGTDKGILTKQTIYDKNGKIQYEKSISYSSFVKTLKTGVRMDLYLTVEGSSLTRIIDCESNTAYRNSGLPDYGNGLYGGIILDNIIAVQTYAYQTVNEPTKETEFWYYNSGNQLSKEITYAYNQKTDGLPIITKPFRVSVKNSNNTMHEVYNYYSCNYSSETPYKDMVAQNMLEYLVASSRSVGKRSTDYTETPYQKTGQLYVPKELIINNEQRVKYENYDSRGNLIYATKDGRQEVVTLYSYNYSYPVIVVEGASLDLVKNILIKNGFSSVEQFGASIPSDAQIEKVGTALRNNLQSAMVTTYTYKLNVGLTSVTDCRGYKTFYDYDTAGRLINVWEKNETGNGKNLLNTYKYNYSTK